MVEGFITNKEKTTFREIVLQHLKDILKISQSEFRGGYWKNILRNGVYEKEYVPDSRQCYIQSIENLAIILIPHFDKVMIEKYKKLESVFYMSISDFMKEYEKKIKEAHNVFAPNTKIGISEIEIFFTMEKLNKAKELFKELNLLMKRIDYLKASVYSEGMEDDEDLVDVDEE